MECPHGLPLQVVKDFGCDDCLNEGQGGVMERLEEIRKLYLYRATKNTTYPEVDWLIAEVDRLRTKYESSNPRCNKGHINNLPLALWDCPTCVTELRAALAVKEEAYNELIMAVAHKWPNETRHETALRYIKEREDGPSE